MDRHYVSPLNTRREFLNQSALGFGGVALAALCAGDSAFGAANPLAPHAAHFPARAKRMIFLFASGGPSQMDLFEPKPVLKKMHGQKLPFALPNEASVGLESTRLMGPISTFRKCGESGLEFGDLLPELQKHVDDLCLLSALQTDTPAHAPASIQMHCGVFSTVRPSLGSWLTYGLGTENRNLPGFVAINPPGGSQGGLRNYGSAFLPAIHQGTPIRNLKGTPINNLVDPTLAPELQRHQLDLLQSMNRRHLQRERADRQMEGMIESFELAFRMQSEAPKQFDISGETQDTLRMYGMDRKETASSGRMCLMARRLAEAGVRFVQIGLGNWDHHSQIAAEHPKSCHGIDRPVAGLLKDLKQRGLLEDTLVLFSGEFGRTPYSQDLTKNSAFSEHGREHNPFGFTGWLAGAGVKTGIRHGETDEFGYKGIAGKVHVHDLHATLLHLLGLNHEKLTYRVSGRDYRLTDVHGHVVHEILA